MDKNRRAEIVYVKIFTYKCSGGYQASTRLILLMVLLWYGYDHENANAN